MKRAIPSDCLSSTHKTAPHHHFPPSTVSHRFPLQALQDFALITIWHLRELAFPSSDAPRPEQKRMAASNFNLRPSAVPTVPTPDPSFRVSQSFMTDAWHVPLLPPPRRLVDHFRNGDQGRVRDAGVQAMVAWGRSNIAQRMRTKPNCSSNEPHLITIPWSIRQLAPPPLLYPHSLESDL